MTLVIWFVVRPTGFRCGDEALYQVRQAGGCGSVYEEQEQQGRERVQVCRVPERGLFDVLQGCSVEDFGREEG